jgi:hypothetical protein
MVSSLETEPWNCNSTADRALIFSGDLASPPLAKGLTPPTKAAAAAASS